MATEDVILRADYRGAFLPAELDSLANALSNTIPDPAVSIGTLHLQYYGVPPRHVVQLLVRFRFTRPEPPGDVSSEATEAILSWARSVWRQREQTRSGSPPIVVTVIHDDRSVDEAWESRVLKRVILDGPDGEPLPFDGRFNGP